MKSNGTVNNARFTLEAIFHLIPISKRKASSHQQTKSRTTSRLLRLRRRKPSSQPQCPHSNNSPNCPSCAYLADQALDSAVRDALLSKAWTKAEVGSTPVYMFKKSRVADLRPDQNETGPGSLADAREAEFRWRMEKSEEWLIGRHRKRLRNMILVESDEEE